MRLAAALLIAAASGAPAAGPPGLGEDPHLAAVPRTAEEAARVAAIRAAPASFDRAEPGEADAGGAATARDATGAAPFGQPSANLGAAQAEAFRLGRGLFRRVWVSAGSTALSASASASAAASDGLGPLYNARACAGCHREDGRGDPPAGAGDEAAPVALRLSIPDPADPMGARIPGWIGTAPDPTYGLQLQDFGAAGHEAEHRLAVRWEEIPVALSDGETASLRRPRWRAESLGYGPLHPQAMLSPRRAPPLIGLGLLEAIPAADILAAADPDDADGDGVSGRPAIVWSVEFDRPMLGRFGWKAEAPTLREQTSGAFAVDMGLSTPLHPAGWGDCTAGQGACRAARHGGDAAHAGLEVDAAGLDLVVFHSRNLAPPARRDVDDPTVLRGKAMFHAAGCAACHTPTHVTHRLSDRPEQSLQVIRPYTDLLLHDMGEGLADGRPEGVATGREWRTPPLWGLGLTGGGSGDARLLHDGRARSALEAILWHGGEAQAARDAVAAMRREDRAALLRFLDSL